jgi:hypothetical protein
MESVMALPPIRYLDLILVVVAAPVLLALGVPAVGYAIGAGTWLLLRCLGVAVDHQTLAAGPDAGAMTQLSRQLSLRLGYRFARILALAIASIVVIKDAGRVDGLTTVLVIALAFTLQLVCGAVDRRSDLPGPAKPGQALGGDVRGPADSPADRSEAGRRPQP